MEKQQAKAGTDRNGWLCRLGHLLERWLLVPTPRVLQGFYKINMAALGVTAVAEQIEAKFASFTGPHFVSNFSATVHINDKCTMVLLPSFFAMEVISLRQNQSSYQF